jgi:hypothetical protein
MANASSHSSNPNDPDLTQYTDFQLLSYFTEIVGKELSPSLKLSAWEIMRRYAHQLSISDSKQTNTGDNDPKWGDAKRVELIYGIRRGVLTSLHKERLITSKTLEAGRKGSRAKRLYSLRSIDAYLQSQPQ